MAIQYPINIVTDRFTVYSTSTMAPILDGNGRPMTGVKWGSKDVTQMIPNLAPDIHWLIEVKEARPAYDIDTQKLVRYVTYDVDNETVTEGYNVVDLTQAEIDARIPDHYETVAPLSGIKLAVEDHDQNAFSRMLNLVNQAGMADEDIVTIKDVYGITHPITVADFKSIMIPYGQYCYTMFLS